MVSSLVRFLVTCCEESQTNERVFELGKNKDLKNNKFLLYSKVKMRACFL